MFLKSFIDYYLCGGISYWAKHSIHYIVGFFFLEMELRLFERRGKNIEVLKCLYLSANKFVIWRWFLLMFWAFLGKELSAPVLCISSTYIPSRGLFSLESLETTDLDEGVSATRLASGSHPKSTHHVTATASQQGDFVEKLINREVETDL